MLCKTSDQDWDPSIIDSEIADYDAWANSIPDDDNEEGDRPFDRLGVLKSNKTVVKNYDDNNILEETLDYFEKFDQYVLTDDFYEALPRHGPQGNWFECNMADLLDTNLNDVIPDIPVEYEVHQACKRPTALFMPERRIVFDLKAPETRIFRFE